MNDSIESLIGYLRATYTKTQWHADASDRYPGDVLITAYVGIDGKIARIQSYLNATIASEMNTDELRHWADTIFVNKVGDFAQDHADELSATFDEWNPAKLMGAKQKPQPFGHGS